MLTVRFSASAFVCCIALTTACGGSSSGSPDAGPSNNFGATANGANEVPANGTTGSGAATFTLNGTTMNYTITYTGLTAAPGSGHIHVGASTVAGPVVVGFTGLPTTAAGTFSGSFTTADVKAQTSPVINSLDDLVAQMRAGNTYVNLHTPSYTGGEIRGQIATK